MKKTEPPVRDRVGNYLTVEGLLPWDMFRVEFPVVESTETFTLRSYQRQCTCDFRGNTLVDISPRLDRPDLTKISSDDGVLFEVRKGHPIYLCDHMKTDKAPLKTVERFAASTLV